ncbi:hypothetical protein H0H92_007412 [Tricholoma furcatifolium]|nr:hypothetical protein H0H92_007412 [Tricholoma furcatifolium]
MLPIQSSIEAPPQSQMKACDSKKRAYRISNSDELKLVLSQSGDMPAPPSKKQKVDSAGGVNNLNLVDYVVNSMKSDEFWDMHMFIGGSFDIYATSIPCLQAALKSTGSGRNYPALLAKMQEFWQADDYCTAKISLELPESHLKEGCGSLHSEHTEFIDPVEGVPFAVKISNLLISENITLPAHVAMHPKRKSAIVQGTLGLKYPKGFMSADGEIMIRVDPVWVGARAIYEGYIKFSVNYGPLYSYMGFREGSKVGFGFWAMGGLLQ